MQAGTQRKQKLTKSVVTAAEKAAAEYVIWDTEIAGFGLRVSPSGAKSFILKYRVGHGRAAPIRKPTIAKVGDITVEQARSTAADMKAQVRLGGDPSGDRQKQKQLPTVADLARDYLDRHAVKKRTGWEDEARLNRVLLPKLGSKAVKDVTRRDIEDLHRSWAKSPYEANRHLSLWSKMFSLAVNWQWRGDNPASGIERFPEERRQRFLSPAELGRLAEALNVHPEKASANAIRLLMLTGARRGEVLAATWDQFDLQRAVWTKPSSHTKQKKEHRVPLSPAAMIVIGRMSEHRDGNYVFPGGSTGKPLTTIRKTWLAVCTKAGLPAVRLHDLRHSYASALAAHGYSLPIIGALLGHSNPSTTARYAHLADDPLREATERVAGVLSGQPAAATMPFTKSA